MKFSSSVLGYPENYFVFLLSESFSIFNVICVFRDIDGSKERKERTSRKLLKNFKLDAQPSAEVSACDE